MPAEESIIPFGYCHCGCGQPTSLAPQTSTSRRWVKGQPMNFANGHHLFVTNVSWLIEALDGDGLDEKCLLWPFSCNNKGYGQALFQGRMVLAHRLAFFLVYGHWPTPKACHRCDTRACVNAKYHIFEGTQQDNIDDAGRKGRLGRKLTPEIVAAIRREYVRGKPGCSTIALAAKYGVMQTMISSIVNRKTWKHVA